MFFLANTEAVFFVDDHQPEVLDLHIVLQQLVRADDDVDLALGQVGHGGVHFLGGLEAAHHFHGDRPIGEAVAEAVVVLLGEQGGRHQNRDLLAAVHGNERGAHRHFGLAETDIAAYQPVHWLGREHVGAHGFDGGLLVDGFLERETGAEGFVVGFRVGEGIPFACGAAGVDVQQFGGHVAHLLGGLALGLLPGFRAQAMQRGQGIVAAGIACDQVQVRHGHVEFGAFGIFQCEELRRLVVDLQCRQAQVAAHAVVDVYHRRAFAQLGEVLDDGVVGGIGAFLTTSALHDALAEQRAFGHQRHRRIVEDQALVQRCDGDCQSILACDEIRPALDRFWSQLQPIEQFQ